MSKLTSSSLAALYVFNPTLGDEDTEGEKILFFHPPIDINRQKDYVGISEGLINFTREFSPLEPCTAVRCEKSRYAFFQAETNYWFVVVVNNPVIMTKNKTTNEMNDEYLEDELHDSVLQAIIRRAYALYRLFNGTFTNFRKCGGIEALRTSISQFMMYYLPTVRFDQLRFYTDIHGFQFLPVDKTTFLTLQYVVNKLKQTFPMVVSCAFMYNSNLIWSGLNQDDIFLLYTLQQSPDVMQTFYTYMCLNTPASDPRYNGNDEMKQQQQQQQTSSTPTHSRRASLPPNVASAFLTGPYSYIVQPVEKQQGHTRLTHRHSASSGLSMPTDSSTKNDVFASTVGAPRVFLRVDPSFDHINYTDTPPSKLLLDPLSRANIIDPIVENEALNRVNRLVVYQRSGITLFLILNCTEQTEEKTATTTETTRKIHSLSISDRDSDAHNIDKDPTFYSSLDSFINADMEKLGKMLAKQKDKIQNRVEPFRFLYFNHANLALKTSLNNKNSPLSIETIQLIRQMHGDFHNAFESQENDSSATEVCVRTRDGWVVGRRATRTCREFFVLLDEKDGNLSDVEDEVQRLVRTYFYNIFVH